jgi:RNA polymerase sigma factor (sigma-70 family)
MHDHASSDPRVAPAPPIQKEDVELLRHYVATGAEDAFAELVRRRIGLVYSVALRQTRGDRHRAEDATQAVFADLARKAPTLAQRPVLAGWLYRSAQFAAAGLLRAEQRRQAREQVADTMEKILAPTNPEPDWDQVRPILDEALNEIAERDRDAIALRFFDGRPFGEIGAQLRLTENAARMRVERALDKLHSALSRRGITSTTAALGLALGQQAGATLPAGLAASVTGAALAGSAAGTGGLLTSLFLMNKLQIGIAGAVAIAGVTGFLAQSGTNADLRREIALLQPTQQSVASVRAENQRLAAAAAEVEALRGDDIELRQLSARIAEVQRELGEKERIARTSNASVSLRLPQADLATALSAYESLVGARVIRDASLFGAHAVIDLVISQRIPHEQALQALATALRERAGVVFEPNPDGTVTAKRLPAQLR